MVSIVAILCLIGLTLGLPLEDLSNDTPNDLSNDLLSQSKIDLKSFASIMTSPHITTENFQQNPQTLVSKSSLKVESNVQLPVVHTSHLIEASKDSAIGAAKLPLVVSAESAAVGGGLTAAAGVKGSAFGSALATPIILKSVALPGVAGLKTASIMAIPKVLVQNLNSISTAFSNNLKTSLNSAHNWTEMLVLENPEQLENEGSLAFNKSTEQLTNTVKVIKAGAIGLKAGTVGVIKAGALGLKAGTVGLATKGLLVAKKGVYVAGRLIMKPIAVIAGAHLKMLGTGLAIGGKLIGGTGAGIAKAGTAVKYAGLGGIGVGASAVAWGFDKSTISKHLEVDNENQS